ALGVPPGTPGVDLVDAPAGTPASRLSRAIGVALRAPDPITGVPAGAAEFATGPVVADGAAGEVTATIVLRSGPGPRGPLAPGGLRAPGALAGRIAAAAWTEDLAVRITADLTPPGRLQVRAADAAGRATGG